MVHSPARKYVTFVLLFLLGTFCYAASVTGTLPVVYLNTDAPVTDKENYIAGSLYIDPLNTGYEALGTKETPVAGQVKGRGNWTWNGFDKKPYRIKFDAKQIVLGMPANKHWCLMASADDALGFLRMPAGFRISEAVGLRWTPATVPVELVMNGQYKGLYFLTEHVRIGANRVHITEQDDLATDSVSGGWLVEIDNYDEEGNIQFYEGNGQHVMVTPKSPEILSARQRQYVSDQIFAINEALYGSSAQTLFGMLDVNEAARFYLVQEIMEDCESYHGSCYLHKDRDRNGVTAKWFFGPVWDFGNAYERHQDKWIYDNPTWPQYWIGQLAQWPEFQRAVKEQWWLFYHTQKDIVRADIRAFANTIETAAKKDASVWRNTQNYRDNSNYSDVRDRFFRRYDWRINWLYAQWGEGIKPANQSVPSIESDQPSRVSHKLLRNGRLIIERNGRLYTLTGQPVP